ncbi:MAG: serine protease [Sphingobacteriaceae bacterium]
MRDIPEQNLSFASLISIGQSSGSGFLLNIKESTFLVTARHVLFDEENNFKKRDEFFEIASPSSVETDYSVSRLRVNFDSVRHLYSKNSDVAVVEIGKNEHLKSNNTYVITYSKDVVEIEKSVNNPTITIEETISKIEDVIIANDVYVFGYPTSLGIQPNKFFDATRPLLRKGIVSNIYKKNNTIILDCAVYPGNSGGPVLQISSDDRMHRYRIIGVVSKYIPFAQEWRNNREKLVNVEYVNSGYSVATAMDEVIKLALTLQNE